MRMEQRPGIHLNGDQKVVAIALVHLDMMYDVMFYSLSGLNAFICKLDEKKQKEIGKPQRSLCLSSVWRATRYCPTKAPSSVDGCS